MTTTVPQMTQAPQGAPSSSVNNPVFNGQQTAQSSAHPMQFVQPVYVLPEEKNTHTAGWVIAMISVVIGALGTISVFVLNHQTGGGASLVLGLAGLIMAIASRHRGHMRVAGVALGIMNMLLGILFRPFEMLLFVMAMMGV